MLVNETLTMKVSQNDRMKSEVSNSTVLGVELLVQVHHRKTSVKVQS